MAKKKVAQKQQCGRPKELCRKMEGMLLQAAVNLTGAAAAILKRDAQIRELELKLATTELALERKMTVLPGRRLKSKGDRRARQ